MCQIGFSVNFWTSETTWLILTIFIMQKRNEKKDFKEGLVWSRKNKNWCYPWKSSSLHLIIESSHWIHLLNTIIMWSSQNSQNVFCVFIYDYSWTTKSSEAQILTHLFYAFLCICVLIILSVCWMAGLYSKCCLLNIFLPIAWKVPNWYSGFQWRVDDPWRVWSHVFKGQCQTVIPHSKCCQLNILVFYAWSLQNLELCLPLESRWSL